jgi:RNA polymerase sigma factor (TIGR02999 family)
MLARPIQNPRPSRDLSKPVNRGFLNLKNGFTSRAIFGVEFASEVQMEAGAGNDITSLLLDWSRGNREALNQLAPLIYDELHRMASRQLRRERNEHTLQSTALVHEVYLKLIDQQRVQWQDRSHFFAVASQMIRRILVDHARAHRSAKRGGGKTRLEFDESIALPGQRDADLLALDDAMDSLARVDARQSRIVELRFFGGLSIEEASEVLEVSPATVKRDWIVAKAWLYRQLARNAENEF